MTPEQTNLLDAARKARELVQKATPGPWESFGEALFAAVKGPSLPHRIEEFLRAARFTNPKP